MIFLLASLIAINSFTSGQSNVSHYENSTIHDSYVQAKPHFTASRAKSGFLVRNRGCTMPALDPFDPFVQPYVHKENPIVCELDGKRTPLFESNVSSIYVNPQTRDQYYDKSEKINCCWRTFWRADNEDNGVKYNSYCENFTAETLPIMKEFIKIECKSKGKTYRDYHAFLPRKSAVEERCRNAKSPDPDTRRLSILVIGLDSVSRLNFHRMMPKTISALRSLEALEMLGYNKVADNTYPNLVPVLSGFSVQEFHKICWGTDKISPSMHFDKCPLIWQNFSSAGYRTIFAEDACSMTTFNYLKPGFKDQPTDYYLRPYCVASETDIGRNHKLNANLCLGTRMNFESLLSYARKVATEFSNDAYFAFIWQASLTHDYFNFPQLGDATYHDFLTFVKERSLLNNTALIVMSDHGMRWGEYRQTFQGRVEDSLPFIFLILPTWWKEKFPDAWQNIQRNANSLTTPFDLHETLNDLLNPQQLDEIVLSGRVEDLATRNLPRGISWFLPIPSYRTCSMAGIAAHWCMCHTSNNVSLEDPAVVKVVDFLIGELNKKLKDYPKCATLKLNKILYAKSLEYKAEPEDKKVPWTDYTVTLQTTPGNAIFEGSVRNRNDNGTMVVTGSISRLNPYGSHGGCVGDSLMRLYCYCL
ncbi:uncharacterized protein LOC105696632 isoform X2 [Orussus abietinus]|nr:uncharacterized protein LOC105696632 isoform X2 [Orussus abietinus]